MGLRGMNRRAFKRAPEAERRRDLIEATLDCVSEFGLQGTTVRSVAVRAGVTNGLIRHYFAGKDQMIQAAYRETIAGMTRPAEAAVESCDGPATERLRRFLVASLSPPAIDARTLSLWASFISLIHVDRTMAEIHREGYRGFRDIVATLVAAIFKEAGQPLSPRACQRHAFTINAVIDGLWLEGNLAGEEFEPGALPGLAIEAVEALLGLSLTEDR